MSSQRPKGLGIRHSLLSFLAAVMLLAIAATVEAQAETITLDAIDSGWYRQSDGFGNTSSPNYIAGITSDPGGPMRDFFAFDVSGVPKNIKSAVLRLEPGNISASGTYTLYDVVSDPATVIAGGNGLSAVYDDLGTGEAYASIELDPSQSTCDVYGCGFPISNPPIEISLNQQAINALRTAESLFLLGGEYASTGYTFGFTGQKADGTPFIRQLIITTQPAAEQTQKTRYTYTRVADTNGPLIGFGAPSINVRGTVAFEASFSAGRRAIFTGNGGSLTTIADTADGVFSEFSDDVRINPRDTVAFGADLAAGGRGIFIGNGGPLITIADTTAGIFSDLFGVSINPAEVVAFHGALASGGTGIFVSKHGELTTIADTSGVFSLFGTPSINASGTVAFLAGFDTGGVGLFSGKGGSLTAITDTNSGTFNFLSSPSINPRGTIAFMAGFPAGDSGIFTGDGGSLMMIADTTGDVFSSFGVRPSINARGAVAFTASLNTGELGIFTGPDPVADKVIVTGDSFFGSLVTFVGTSHQSLNDRGEIAFSASLADGTQGIYVATPGGRGIQVIKD